MTTALTEAPTRQPLALSETGGLEIRSLEDAYRFAKAIAGSSILPKGVKDERDIVAIVSLAREIRLGIWQAMTSTAVINGRPSIYGDAALALVRRSGLLAEFKETTIPDVTGDEAGRRCYAKRIDGTESEWDFTVADAKRAKLWAKAGPWTEYPKRMLQMRARSFVLRDLFGDVLSGIAIYEEQQDAPEDRVATARVVEGVPKFLGSPKTTESELEQKTPADTTDDPPAKKPGRPKGSKNKPKKEEPVPEPEEKAATPEDKESDTTEDTGPPLKLEAEPTRPADPLRDDADWLRDQLDEAGIDEAIVFDVLAELSMAGDDAPTIDDIPDSTLRTIRDGWASFASKLSEAAVKGGGK